MFYLFTPGTDDTQLVSSPDGSDNQSNYEADDEASLLPSPADTYANGDNLDDSGYGDNLDDSGYGDIGQIILGNFEDFLFEIFALPILLPYYVITQALRII